MSVTYGDCIVSQRYGAEGDIVGLWVERADPRVLIAPELLQSIADGNPGWPVTFDGEVLRIDGINQTVVYRITGRLDNGDGWRDPCLVGEWPD